MKAVIQQLDGISMDSILYTIVEFCHYWQAYEFIDACHKRHIECNQPMMDIYGNIYVHVDKGLQKTV